MKFGIERLDELLGDISDGSVILIEGVGEIPFMMGKLFLKNAIKMEYEVFAIVPERARKLLDDLKGLRIVTPDDTFSLQDLFTISLVVRDLKEKVGLIDIFQQLLMIHEPEKVYQLLREVCQLIRNKGGVAVVILDKRICDERTLAMFEVESDFVIEVEEIAEGLKIKRGIRVKKSPTKPPSDYYKLEIDDGEFRIGEKV